VHSKNVCQTRPCLGRAPACTKTDIVYVLRVGWRAPSMHPCLHPPAPSCHGWMDLLDGRTPWMAACTRSISRLHARAPSPCCMLHARSPSHVPMHALHLVMLHLVASLLHGSLALWDVGCRKVGRSLRQEFLEGARGSRLGSMMLQQQEAAASASFLLLSLDSLFLECVGVRCMWAQVPAAAGACSRRRASCV
jgi:hypothetical protein